MWKAVYGEPDWGLSPSLRGRKNVIGLLKQRADHDPDLQPI